MSLRSSPILTRYLVREISSAMIGVALLLVLVIFSGLLTAVLDKIARGVLPASLLLSQIALRIPNALILLLPLAGFLGVILAFTRLYRDSEMAVLRAAGFSELGLTRPVWVFAIPMALLLSVLSLYVAPTAQRIAKDQIEAANRQVAVAGLEPGRFVELRSGAVVYAGALEQEKSFSDVFIARETEDGELQIVRATRGFVGNQGANTVTELTLEGGERTAISLDPDDRDSERASFEVARIALPESLQKRDSSYEVADLALSDLPDSREGRAEWQGRIGVPLMLLLLMLLAPAMARSAPRQVRYDRIVIGVLLFLVYSQALELAKKAYALGRSPEWLSTWWVHALFLLVLLSAYHAPLLAAWRTRRFHQGAPR
jgi:lipopolysaccharide export system permease protein